MDSTNHAGTVDEFDRTNQSGTHREGVLQGALDAVIRSRNSNYGDPEDNFHTIAELWRTYSERRFGQIVPFEPYDVANLMVLLKMARAAHNPFIQDNYVDTAGYAATGGETAQRAERAHRQPRTIGGNVTIEPNSPLDISSN